MAASFVAGLMMLGGAVTALSMSPSAAGASGAPIKIGEVCGCTGPLAAGVKDIPAVYKAWAASVNANGGINGHKIEIIFKDDASNPATSVSEVHTLIQTDHVVAIADETNNDQAWAAYVQQNNVPVIGVTTSTEPFFLNNSFYPEGQTEDSLFYGITDAVKQAGGTKFALFYCAEAVQCQEGIAPLVAQAKTVGEDVVATLQVSASAPNYTAQCLAAKQAGATVIFTADAQTVDEKIIQDCYSQGYKPKVVIDGEVLLPSFTTTPGINQATYFTVPNFPYFVNTPAIKTMNQTLDKYAPGVRKDVNYGELPVEAWISGKLFQAAAQAGGLGANGKAPTSARIDQGFEFSPRHDPRWFGACAHLHGR